MQTSEDLTGSADKAAIGLSLICALHCLFFPVAVALLPSAALLGLNDEWFHGVMLILVLPLSLLALLSGLRKHRNNTVLGIGVIGLSILIIGAIVGHDIFGETGERVITVIGSTLIAISHLKNFQLSHSKSSDIHSESN